MRSSARDMTILRAVVLARDEGIEVIDVDGLSSRTGFNAHEVQHALQTFDREDPPHYFIALLEPNKADILAVMQPTVHARRQISDWLSELQPTSRDLMASAQRASAGPSRRRWRAARRIAVPLGGAGLTLLGRLVSEQFGD